jgi:hypothetical protein
MQMHHCICSLTGIPLFTKPFWVYFHFIWPFLLFRNVVSTLRSQDFILLTVPNVRTEFGKRAFIYSAPSAWNALQNPFKLVPIGVFKSLMKDFEADSLTYQCF